MFAEEEEGSTICFCVHLPQEGSAICSHVCYPSWPSIHGSVPWDLLNGEEKAGVVGIWGGDVVPLLTDFVRPLLLLASAQNSCFTLGQRSLPCHTVPSQRDRGRSLVMWPLGVDISAWVTDEGKVEFPHKISLIYRLTFPLSISTGKICTYISYIAIILVMYYREVKWSHSY